MRTILVCILLIPVWGNAQIRLAKIFSGNMVLQRNQPVHVWGSGQPGLEVRVQFAGSTQTTKVKSDSSWSLYFKPMAASLQPVDMNIAAGNKNLQLQNILIGDIWLCLGQSNMEFPLQQEMHYQEERQHANQPYIRLYNPGFTGKNIFAKSYTDSMITALNEGDFYKGDWQNCDSISVKTMSAIGYYFGKVIQQSEKIPIGLIHLAIGGCPIETFISKDALAPSKQFTDKLSGNWMQNEQLPVWVRQRAVENLGKYGALNNDRGPAHADRPGFAYSAGIEPLLGLPITGILWYQGESNAQEPARVSEYAALQELMIADYRAKWRRPDLPFLWVQLSSIDTIAYTAQLWPQFRDEQRKLLGRIPFGGMAVSSDLGSRNNVHPTNKKQPAERLARWALLHTYHKNIVPSGPLPLRAVYHKGKVMVSFQFANGLQSVGGSLKGFSVDGSTDIPAGIIHEQVVVAVTNKPTYVYYGWKPFTDGNLVNAENLPASTFKIKCDEK